MRRASPSERKSRPNWSSACGRDSGIPGAQDHEPEAPARENPLWNSPSLALRARFLALRLISWPVSDLPREPLDGAVARHEHRVAYVEPRPELATVVEVEVFVDRADPAGRVEPDRTIAVQHVLTPAGVVRAVALENPGEVFMRRSVGDHRHGHRRARLERPGPPGLAIVAGVVGIVPAEQVPVAVRVGAADLL